MSQLKPMTQERPSPDPDHEQQSEAKDDSQSGGKSKRQSKARMCSYHTADQPTEQEFVIKDDGANDGSQPGTGDAVPYSIRQFPMRDPEAPHHRKRRPRSPGLKWFKQYDDPGCFKDGRVLVIDYIKQGL